MLPDGDGLELVKKFKKKSSAILLLLAKKT